jgi:hypothetical protein
MAKKVVHFNLTPELLDALDAHVEQRRANGIETSRSAEARSLLRFALQHATAQKEHDQ